MDNTWFVLCDEFERITRETYVESGADGYYIYIDRFKGSGDYGIDVYIHPFDPRPRVQQPPPVCLKMPDPVPIAFDKLEYHSSFHISCLVFRVSTIGVTVIKYHDHKYLSYVGVLHGIDSFPVLLYSFSIHDPESFVKVRDCVLGLFWGM